jgi:hypothetical protein
MWIFIVSGLIPFALFVAILKWLDLSFMARLVGYAIFWAAWILIAVTQL